MKRKDIYKIRYKIYRDLGYSAKEAQKLRSRALDVEGVELDTKGKVKTDSNEYVNALREAPMEMMINEFKRFKDKATSESDTVLTDWGKVTHDKRYDDYTMNVVNKIKRELNLTTDQAYYFLYMTTDKNNMNYRQAKRELLSNKEFEMYVSRKK